MKHIFGFFIVIFGNFGLIGWVIGLLCLINPVIVMVYSFLACLYIEAELWVYLLGTICILWDEL